MRSNRWDDLQGKPWYSEKTCPSAALSTTNTKLLDLGSNLGCRGGNPATNRLSYGTAIMVMYKLHTKLSAYMFCSFQAVKPEGSGFEIR
jgi:hypothetical protein